MERSKILLLPFFLSSVQAVSAELELQHTPTSASSRSLPSISDLCAVSARLRSAQTVVVVGSKDLEDHICGDGVPVIHMTSFNADVLRSQVYRARHAVLHDLRGLDENQRTSALAQVEATFYHGAAYIFFLDESGDDKALLTKLSFDSILSKAKHLVFFLAPAEHSEHSRPWAVWRPNRVRDVVEVVDFWNDAGSPSLTSLRVENHREHDNDNDIDDLLFPGEPTDLTGRDLRVTTFEFLPHVQVIEAPDGTKSYSGVEIRILREVARVLGFEPSFRPPIYGTRWGKFFRENMTFSGLRGDIQFGRTDLGIANLFISEFNALFADMTAAYNFDRYCFLLRKPEEVPNWLGLINPFTWHTWLTLVLTFALSTMVLIFFAHFFSQSAGISKQNAFLFALGSVFGEPYHFTPKLESIRIFLAPFLLCMAVLTMSYSGTLMSFLTVKVQPSPMQTIEELSWSDLTVGTIFNGENFKNFILNSEVPKYQRIASNFEPYRVYSEAYDRASRGELVMAEAKLRHDFAVREKFTDEFGQTSLYVMEECLFSFPVAFSLPKHSHFTKAISAKMRAIREAGLVEKWFNDKMDSVARQAQPDSLVGSDLQPLSVDDLRVPFVLILVLLLVCLAVMPLEAFCFRGSSQ